MPKSFLLIVFCKISFKSFALHLISFLLGDRTWISVGLTEYFAGNLAMTRLLISSSTLSGLLSCKKKKSVPGSEFFKLIGLLFMILWAFRMILLPSACLKISVSVITGITPDSIMSCKILPGPIAGNWFSSPTRINLLEDLTALRRLFIKRTLTIETSSTTITSW